MLAVFFEAAVAQEPALAAPEGAMGPGRAAVQVMLNRLARSKTFSQVAERALLAVIRRERVGVIAGERAWC